MPSKSFNKTIFYFKTGVSKDSQLWPMSVNVLIGWLTAPVEQFGTAALLVHEAFLQIL